ncbi:ABC transporter substrate-binding protein [Nitrosomonas sp. Nm33]|uniref:ABC transporter substrate-binding protein n=1 Tax=Nitrosomonas sp. Nm33 TaxID=133724 RepID=UPI00089789D2|nr:ABC transporter substrate-binding protein [Nitrosomonas sp. Nm33]SDZ05516.1 phospholipid transport system substrate-binding protein [Nitrosomonas sp. Nm33]
MRSLLEFRSIKYVLITLILLSLATVARAQDFQSDTPEHVIQGLQETFIQTMKKGDELGYRGRLELMTPAINRSHDMDTIIRSILGANWNKLDGKQQQKISETFRKLSIATYAERFNRYDRERFEIIEQRLLPRDQILVRSKLIQADGNSINFDYVLHQSKEGWLIINILVDGVSDLAMKRAEYNAILKRDGFEALIAMLEQKILQTEQN